MLNSWTAELNLQHRYSEGFCTPTIRPVGILIKVRDRSVGSNYTVRWNASLGFCSPRLWLKDIKSITTINIFLIEFEKNKYIISLIYSKVIKYEQFLLIFEQVAKKKSLWRIKNLRAGFWPPPGRRFGSEKRGYSTPDMNNI